MYTPPGSWHLSPFVLLLLAAPAGAAPVALPNGDRLAEVDFERHVAALFGRAGCSAGSCHGSFQGKGGFRLSLFGHDPAADYHALTRGGLGRRTNPNDPDSSLLLLKPTARAPHEGGRRFAWGSWQYQVLRAWIAAGSRRVPGSAAVRGIEVRPAEHHFRKAGETVRIQVRVAFADGTNADVAPFCEIRSRDDAVAEVTTDGLVRATGPGDAALVVSYLGHIRTARVYVPVVAPPGFAYPAVPENNFVDREVFARLRALNIVPSDLAPDEAFLRRVTLDVIGTLPSPREVRAFLEDNHPLKRGRKIDELLAHPMHAALWATRLCDVTGANVDVMEGPPPQRARRAKMWHDWFRRRLAENVPYDRIVRGVLCATSRDGRDAPEWIRDEATLHEQLGKGFATDYARRPGLDLFWRRGGPQGPFTTEQMAEQTAAAFLGVRIDCARCHKHPFDRWTQQDYRAYANVFALTQYGASPEVRAALQSLLEQQRQRGTAAPSRSLPPLREVYLAPRPVSLLSDPRTGKALGPKALGGPAFELKGDPREALFRWLTSPENPTFARSFANRVWAHYFGRGLVEPVDGFSVANPPSNAKLLDALANDFVDSGYDLRRLERTILASRTYQLSSIPNESNAHDRTNLSHAAVRRPMAEIVADALHDALGVRPDLGGDAPPGSRAIEVATNRARDRHLARVFRLFGRPERTAACDCERSSDPVLPQTLFLMTDPGLLTMIRGGRLARLLAQRNADAEVVEELFLATLSRFPDGDEKRWASEHLATKKREGAFVDIFWALINTREFILNH